jgi:membrane-associated protease RseP (regulator of RpoE activity)
MKLHVRGSKGILPVLALVAQGALAQSGGAAAGAVQPAKAMIIVRDSTGGRRGFIITPLIDSLVKRLDVVPLGSAEFVATNAALETAITAQMRPGDVSGSYHVEVVAPRAVMGLPMDVVPQGRLGFTADGIKRAWYGPGGNYLQYFEYPSVIAIETNSPASKSGVKTGDLLLAYDGLDVTKNPINMTQLLMPGREVVVKLRRDGDTRDVQMTVEKAPPDLLAERRREAFTNGMEQRRLVEAQAGAMARATSPTPSAKASVAAGMIGPYRDAPVAAMTLAPSVNGALGAAMTELDASFAVAIKGADGKRGVVVTKVPVGSLADRTGLRNGDVILRVGASDVATLSQLRVRLLDADQSGPEKVKLVILRGGKTQDITYYTRER